MCPSVNVFDFVNSVFSFQWGCVWGFDLKTVKSKIQGEYILWTQCLQFEWGCVFDPKTVKSQIQVGICFVSKLSEDVSAQGLQDLARPLFLQTLVSPESGWHRRAKMRHKSYINVTKVINITHSSIMWTWKNLQGHSFVSNTLFQLRLTHTKVQHCVLSKIWKLGKIPWNGEALE